MYSLPVDALRTVARGLHGVLCTVAESGVCLERACNVLKRALACTFLVKRCNQLRPAEVVSDLSPQGVGLGRPCTKVLHRYTIFHLGRQQELA